MENKNDMTQSSAHDERAMTAAIIIHCLTEKIRQLEQHLAVAGAREREISNDVERAEQRVEQGAKRLSAVAAALHSSLASDPWDGLETVITRLEQYVKNSTGCRS